MWEDIINIIQMEDETKPKSWWWRLFSKKTERKDIINSRRWV